ncbi:MAG: cupin domain-containing protein [Rhodobacteraceae bacterium]|nr:cupin domain-containing protein [Paracoccaceae bacterium]
MTEPARKAGTKIGALLRKRRRQMSLTLQQLGEKSGVSYSYLSQVERDNATPTLGTLAQVAQALGVGLDYFIATPHPADLVTRATQRMRFGTSGSALQYEQLGAEIPGNELSAFIIHVAPGFQSEVFRHEGEELLYVMEGSITQMVDGTEFLLTAGDSIHYRGNNPHSYRNDSDRPARLLWTGTLKLFHTPGGAAFSPPRTGGPEAEDSQEDKTR